MEVEVIRSTKRKKTVQAKVIDNKIIIRVPNNFTKDEEKNIVNKMSKKLLEKIYVKELNKEEILIKRVKKLNKIYFNGKLNIKSVEFVPNKKTTFGKCNVNEGKIQISQCLKKMPDWVMDYLLIHEMSHTIHPNHSKAFWECVYRFPLAERARGYLIAVSLEKDLTNYSID